jgi:hypothetical protein
MRTLKALTTANVRKFRFFLLIHSKNDQFCYNQVTALPREAVSSTSRAGIWRRHNPLLRSDRFLSYSPLGVHDVHLESS